MWRVIDIVALSFALILLLFQLVSTPLPDDSVLGLSPEYRALLLVLLGGTAVAGIGICLRFRWAFLICVALGILVVYRQTHSLPMFFDYGYGSINGFPDRHVQLHTFEASLNDVKAALYAACSAYCAIRFFVGPWEERVLRPFTQQHLWRLLDLFLAGFALSLVVWEFLVSPNQFMDGPMWTYLSMPPARYFMPMVILLIPLIGIAMRVRWACLLYFFIGAYAVDRQLHGGYLFANHAFLAVVPAHRVFLSGSHASSPSDFRTEALLLVCLYFTTRYFWEPGKQAKKALRPMAQA